MRALDLPKVNYRPLVLFVLTAIMGIWASWSLSGIWLIASYALVGVICCALAAFKRVALCLICIVGFALGALRLYVAYPETVAPPSDTVALSGRICETPVLGEDGWRLTLDQLDAGVELQGKLMLQVYDVGHSFNPLYGDRLSTTTHLFLPQGRRNPGGRDMRAYLMAQGIYYTAAGVDAQAVILEKGASDLYGSLLSVRAALERSIGTSFNAQTSSVVKGLVLGDKKDIDVTTYEAFKDTGLAHLLAVSGLHVSYFVMLVIFLLRPAPVPVKFGVLALFLVAYCAVVGFTASIVRASVMALMLTGSYWAQERYDMLTATAAGALIILLADPFQLFDIGFQLSFAAVTAIAMLGPPMMRALRRLPKWLSATAAISASATLGTLPLTVSYFGRFSLITLPANILIVPLIGVPTLTGFASALLGLISPYAALPFAFVTTVVLGAAVFVIKLMALLPFASINVPWSNMTIMIAYVAALFVASQYFLWKPKYKAILASALLALGVACVLVSNVSAQNRLEITMLDVGNAESIVISSGTKHYLVDCAGNDYGYDQGRNIILPYLYYKGVTKLDGIFISHTHTDHIGGLKGVLDGITVDVVYAGAGAQEDLSALAGDTPIIALCEGDKLMLGDLTLEICSDDTDSLVMLLTRGAFSMLFTGDIEMAGEAELDIARGVTVLKVAHHGSDTSTGALLLDRIRPSIALISCDPGYYGHPSPEVLRRLEQVGASVFRTDECGAITLSVDDDVKVYTMLGRYGV
jgi:competence protein ComEC